MASESEEVNGKRTQLSVVRSLLSNDKDKEGANDIMRLLEAIDKDHDGNFSTGEIIDAVRMLNEERRSHSLHAEIEKIMHKPHVTVEDKAALKILQDMDADGDGKFSSDEVLEGCRKLYRSNNTIAHLRLAVVVQVIIIMLTLGGMLVTSLAAYELSKETQVENDGIMRIAGGAGLVQVAQQRRSAPLGALLYLPQIMHQQLDSFSVKLNDLSMLTMRVQESHFQPAPEPMEGVQRPAVRRVEVLLEATGTVTTGIHPNSEGYFQAQHMQRPVEAALAKVLPAGDMLPLDMRAITQTQVDIFGDHREAEESAGHRRLQEAAPLHVVDEGRRRLEEQSYRDEEVFATPVRFVRFLGEEMQTMAVDVRVELSFSTSRRSLSSLAGVKAAFGDLANLLRSELLADGFQFHDDLRIMVTQVEHEMQPQLRIRAQSGAELLIFDAGHAVLRLPDVPEPVHFCASCGECSSLSVDDEAYAEEARRARFADLDILNKHPDGRRLQLSSCEGCTADFPPRRPGPIEGGGQKTSRSGAHVLPCPFTKLLDGHTLLADGGISVTQLKNMRAFLFDDFGPDDFESARQCAESAWLHEHTCGRDYRGKVRFAFSQAPNSYGRCFCETSFGGTTPEAPAFDASGGTSAVYEGSCDVDQAPRLYVGTALLALRDDKHFGVHYTKQHWVQKLDELNLFFSGHMTQPSPNQFVQSPAQLHKDVRVRLFALGMRTHTSTAYYRQCWEKTRDIASELAPNDAATMNFFTCAGSEKDATGQRTNGWAISISPMSYMEGDPRHKMYSVWMRDDIIEGKINSPKTLSHEVGHALGLKHTWGDGSGSCTFGHADQVPDTPHNLMVSGAECAEAAKADTCPGVGLRSGGDHHENVMGYCQGQSFTYGQMQRMMEVTARVRPSMWLRGAFWPLAGCSGDVLNSFAAGDDVWAGEYMSAGRDGCVQLCIPDPRCMGIRYDGNSSTCELLGDVTAGAPAADVECWYRRQWMAVMRAPRRLKWTALPAGATPSNWLVWKEMIFEKEGWPLVRGRPAYRNIDDSSPGKYLLYLPREQRWVLSPSRNPASASSYGHTNGDGASPPSGMWEMYVGGGYRDYQVTLSVESGDIDQVPLNLDSVCGNNRKEAGEECDDGQLAPFDQCDPLCADATKYLFLRTERGADNAFTPNAIVRFSFVDRPGHPDFYGLHIILPEGAEAAQAEMTLGHPTACGSSGVCVATTDFKTPQHTASIYSGVELTAVVMWLQRPLVDAAESVASFRVRLRREDGKITAFGSPMCYSPDSGCVGDR